MITFNDIRIRRLLEDIVFPSPKEGMNPSSPAYLRMVLRDKRKSVLFSTFPKCGWNWSSDILEYCITKKYRGTFDIEYGDSGRLNERMIKPVKIFVPADSRARNCKKLRKEFPEINIDYCFHTHGSWKYSSLWGLDQAKTVFIVRNIPSTLFSFYHSKRQIQEYRDFEEFIDDGNLTRAISHYNGWGAFCEKAGSRFKIFKYEEMRKDPVSNFSEMYEFVFGKSIERKILDEALDFFSFKKQKEREFLFEKDESKHFYFQGKADYSDQISPEVLDKINSCLKSNLKHDFGYKYE